MNGWHGCVVLALHLFCTLLFCLDQAGAASPGDLDGDGARTLLDGAAGLKVMTGTAVPGLDGSGELTGDGKISVADSLALLQSLSGVRGSIAQCEAGCGKVLACGILPPDVALSECVDACLQENVIPSETVACLQNVQGCDETFSCLGANREGQLPVVFVAPGGDDQNSGATKETPKATLDAALDAVSIGGTIRMAAGTYGECVTVSKSVTIEGGYDPAFLASDPANGETVLDAVGRGCRPFQLWDLKKSNPQVAVSRMTFTNGVARAYGGGGGVSVNGGNLAIRQGKIVNNRGPGSGGGIEVTYGAFTLENSLVSGNVAEKETGGGINAWYAEITIRDSIIENNHAGDNGGGAMIDDSTATISGSTFTGNISGGGGGGVNANDSTVTITTTQFRNNQATEWNGGANFWECTATVASTTFEGNTTGMGGALGFGPDEFADKVTLKNSEFKDNTPPLGVRGNYVDLGNNIDHDRITLTGRFLTEVQGIKFSFDPAKTWLLFGPEDNNQSGLDERSQPTIDANGNFTANLPKKGNYHVGLMKSGLLAASVQFSFDKGNLLEVPASAPSTFDLGTLMPAAISPSFLFSYSWIPTNSPTWMTGNFILTSGNHPPEVAPITGTEEKRYDPDSNYLGSTFSLAVTATDQEQENLLYWWYLENTSGGATIKGSGAAVRVETDSFGHGMAHVVVIDARGGAAKQSYSF